MGFSFKKTIHSTTMLVSKRANSKILGALGGEEGEHEVMWEEFARMACNMVPWCQFPLPESGMIDDPMVINSIIKHGAIAV